MCAYYWKVFEELFGDRLNDKLVEVCPALSALPCCCPVLAAAAALLCCCCPLPVLCA